MSNPQTPLIPLDQLQSIMEHCDSSHDVARIVNAIGEAESARSKAMHPPAILTLAGFNHDDESGLHCRYLVNLLEPLSLTNLNLATL